MKELKNLTTILCFIFLIFSLAPSCSDEQPSTDMDGIDHLNEAFENVEVDEEQIEIADDEDRKRRRNRRKNRRREKNMQAKVTPDAMLNKEDPTTTTNTVTGQSTHTASSGGACMRTSSDYLACRYEESRQVVDATLQSKQAHVVIEKYNCSPAAINKEDILLKTNIQVILIEYKYAGLTPKNALICEIQAEEQVLGYAHHTQGFCRNNLTARIDSLNEALAEYTRLGYKCHKEGESSRKLETPKPPETSLSETQKSGMDSSAIPVPEDLISEE